MECGILSCKYEYTCDVNLFMMRVGMGPKQSPPCLEDGMNGSGCSFSKGADAAALRCRAAGIPSDVVV